MKIVTKLCDRCGGPQDPTNGVRWEHGWPLYGTIRLGFPAQAFAFLRGREHVAENVDFKWWGEGHPAMAKNEAQEVIFSWSSDGKACLCYDCQKKLLQLIGEFWGIPQWEPKTSMKGKP